MTNLIPTSTSTDEVERQASVAVLPVGSFEQHGSFLPLSTDTIIASAIAHEIASHYPVMLLPPITISCSHEHAAWRGTVSISARTLHQVINDIRESLHKAQISRLALVNGHGGNYVLANIVQEASVDGPHMALFPNSHAWNRAREAADMQTDSHEDMHAGELETSILLHIYPEVVRPGNDTADWIATDRPHLLTVGMAPYTTSGVIGRPSLGTAEKGAKALASLTKSFAEVLDALAEG